MHAVKTRILIPPGLGDAYWVLVKLRGIMKQRGIERPELTILSWEDPRGAHLRSLPYLRMFDWFDIGDQVNEFLRGIRLEFSALPIFI